MNEMQDEHDISERLHRLAHRMPQPGADPRADVRRGRARLRRRNTLATAGSAAAVVGLAGGFAAFSVHDRESLAPAGGGTPTVLDSVSTPTTSPSGPACTTDSADPLADPFKTSPAIVAALTSYAQILASHLDPTGGHLQTIPSGFSGTPQIPCAPGAQLDVGTKLGWGSETGVGEAMVYVSVTNDWADDQIHLDFDRWAAVSPPSGTVRAWTAGGDGTTAVAVKRADGTVVAIETDRVFGNNTTTPVAGFGFTADQLLHAAADPHFVLPR